MTASDALFAGSIPTLYHDHLGPLLFVPYAQDLARRAAALQPRRLLETAAGTGIVTEALVAAIPEAEIVATDLNQAMLDVAAARIASPRVRFRAADAQALPFGDAEFDALVCQFGVMFFPDRIGAYREARRMLAPGGAFLFNVWDSLDENPVSKAVAETVAGLFPDNPPSFLQRTPFGYHDRSRIEADLRAAGFTMIEVETVRLRSPLSSARQAAIGLTHGSPLRAEIEAHGADALERTADAVADTLARLGFDSGGEEPMSAHVISARG
jgi:ubiquinone/menaquinone biosynthesis C-methylase UbiE